ncbi:hypothetical protein D7O10_10265 [Salmonella enterica subsp. enterica serovar Braenderup]|nr:hypothetical protein [Salmonella enterica subsp. enterica serovar Braenderup]ECD3088243.1 hypothetical protein [Salmonella enterica subsp. enterica serovar Braenderup]
MISAEELQRLLNLTEPPTEELIDVYLQFTMIFPRVEQRFFGGFAKCDDSLVYAQTLIDAGVEVPYKLFHVFKQRYILNQNAHQRLQALSFGRARDRQGIINGLQDDGEDDLNTMSTVVKVVIRIRNNLFHGNKDAYLFAESKEQAQLLRHCVKFLQGLLN